MTRRGGSVYCAPDLPCRFLTVVVVRNRLERSSSDVRFRTNGSRAGPMEANRLRDAGRSG